MPPHLSQQGASAANFENMSVSPWHLGSPGPSSGPAGEGAGQSAAQRRRGCIPEKCSPASRQKVSKLTKSGPARERAALRGEEM